MTNALMIPKFRLPRLIAGIGRALPQWPHSLGLITGLNLARQMKLLPEETLQDLAGKVFRVRVNDTGGEASFTYRDGAFRPVFRVEGEPDLAFAANLSAYLQLLARQEDPDTLFFNRELEITGDTELGLRVKNMLDAVEWPNLPFVRR